jgi:hypothetical protein
MRKENHMSKRMLKTGLVGVVLAGASLLAFPAVVSAATPSATGATGASGAKGATGVTSTSANFNKNQQALEAQLAARLTQLTRLSADVKAATDLSAAHLAVLDLNIATATTSITSLSANVPTDTTGAELAADRATMLKDNRVYAVLTPQVFLTIEADTTSSQVASFEANESTLQSSVNVLQGQPGYKNAENHYANFTKRVNAAASASSNVTVDVIAQTPSDYPGDTHIFVKANEALLSANVDLAYASYDESVIGLASGGYTGP